MRNRVGGAVAGLALVVMLLTAAAVHAESLPNGDAPAAAETPDASLTQAAKVDRPWLAQRGDSEPSVVGRSDDSAVSPWRALLVLLLLGGLGGVAWWMRRRRPVTAVHGALEVISSVKVGPKAQLVTVAIGRRVLLLGVTESTVQRLAWLDEALAEPELSSEDVGMAEAIGAPLPEEAAFVPQLSLSALERAAEAQSSRDRGTGDRSLSRAELEVALKGSAKSPPKRAGFADLLRSVLGGETAQGTAPGPQEPPVGSSAAEQLAAETRDVIDRTSRGGGKSEARPGLPKVEGQAAGLAARLQSRRA